MLSIADLNPGAIDRLGKIKKGQRNKYIQGYSNIYSAYGLPNYAASEQLKTSNPDAYAAWRSDIKKMNSSVGRQISANKGSGGLFGGSIGKLLGSFVAPLVGGLAFGPIGAAVGSGAGTLASGGSIKDALISGGLSFAGGKIGGKLFPDAIGSSFSPSNVAGPYTMPGVSALGSSAANAIGANIANTSIGSVLGTYAGNKFADNLTAPQEQAGDFGPDLSLAPETVEPEPFAPKQDAQLSLPGSLTGFSSLDPAQLSSNLATQGVYGGGLGPEESAYFRNLINRRLVDETGMVDPDLSEINPIENSYLSQMGITGSNPTSILEALSRYGNQNNAFA